LLEIQRGVAYAFIHSLVLHHLRHGPVLRMLMVPLHVVSLIQAGRQREVRHASLKSKALWHILGLCAANTRVGHGGLPSYVPGCPWSPRIDSVTAPQSSLARATWGTTLRAEGMKMQMATWVHAYRVCLDFDFTSDPSLSPGLRLDFDKLVNASTVGTGREAFLHNLAAEFDLEGRHRHIRTHSEPCSHFTLPRHDGRPLGHPGTTARVEESTRRRRRRGARGRGHEPGRESLTSLVTSTAATAGYIVKGKVAKHEHGPLATDQCHTADRYETAGPTEAEPRVRPLRLPRLDRHQDIVREPALHRIMMGMNYQPKQEATQLAPPSPIVARAVVDGWCAPTSPRTGPRRHRALEPSPMRDIAC